MAYVEVWVSYAGPDCVVWPKDYIDFAGYMIANFTLREVTHGMRLGRVAIGGKVSIKGNIISLNQAFRYLLRVKRVQNSDREEYEILPVGGFRKAERLPLNWINLRWILRNELDYPSVDAAFQNILASARADDERDITIIQEEVVACQPWHKDMVTKSDYYRMDALCAAWDAWPDGMAAIRKLEVDALRSLAEQLQQRPHDLCYYAHSRNYGLREMSFASLQAITAAVPSSPLSRPAATNKICMGAACFYEMLKQERVSKGHTIFVMDNWLALFKYRHAAFGAAAESCMHWLLREGHLLPLDKDAAYVDRENLFDEPSPVFYLQFPRDDLLKERILGHLRRIHENFRVTSGEFTVRDPEGPVVAVPKGPLNEGQQAALRHVLNNPLTIIMGGPGSGKTAFGAEHLSCLFQEIAVYTHVGTQAVSLCDRLSGSQENSCTIHSAHHQRMKKKPEALLRVKYSERIQTLVVDEVFNVDEWTMEVVLALARNASRVVLIGDPDQIMPIPGEEGAGTPALDIARAFAKHTIVLKENMRQQASARAIHEVVTNIRLKQPMAIAWASAPGVLLRLDPPRQEDMAGLTSILTPLIPRLRRGIERDEHAWQIITFYNGFKPGYQGLGVKQLNEIVEQYITTHEPARKRGGFAINKKLTMYPGFKFMITGKFKPHKSLKPAGLSKRKPAAQGAIRKKMRAMGNGETMYSETRNGQIEVVKSIREKVVKGSSAKAWEVECEPKGRSVRGVKILINARLHVDPQKIEPAWVITSNKAMGKECKNVCVYIPTTIGHSPFDRSSLYVALSRPMEWLAVVGRVEDIRTLTIRDPHPVNTGLSIRLANANVTQPGHEELGWDWKEGHDVDIHGMLNEELISSFEDIYDQSHRVPCPRATSLCALSWSSFLASQEMLLKSNPVALRDLTQTVAAIRFKLHEHVIDHTPRVDPPWERGAIVPAAAARRRGPATAVVAHLELPSADLPVALEVDREEEQEEGRLSAEDDPEEGSDTHVTPFMGSGKRVRASQESESL